MVWMGSTGESRGRVRRTRFDPANIFADGFEVPLAVVARRPGFCFARRWGGELRRKKSMDVAERAQVVEFLVRNGNRDHLLGHHHYFHHGERIESEVLPQTQRIAV